MFTSLWEDVKREFSTGNMVTQLIMLNGAVFLFVILLRLFFGGTDLYSDIMKWFMVSSDLSYLITRPWTLITSMFLHEGFFHILWNMLFLYWFGRIVGDLIGDRHILPLYLIGGLVGNIAFIVTANLLPYGAGEAHFALGASGAVMAIVLASAAVAPDYLMHLILIGAVKLKFIVAVLLLLDLVGIADDMNTGGHFAHLGGALLGYFFIHQLRSGNDWSTRVNGFLRSIRSFFSNIGNSVRGKRKGPHVVYRNKKRWGNRKAGPVTDTEIDLSHQEQLDEILEKIKKTGYENLTSEEKEFLFKASKK